jgi:hypothetical protein
MSSNWAGPEPLWPDDDRYTVVWNELVAAYREHRKQKRQYEFGVYMGLRQAYARLTGDAENEIDRLVAQAATELLAS